MNVLFTIFKIISWGWLIFMGFGLSLSASVGQSDFTLIYIVTALALPAIIFLVWRFNIDKANKAKKQEEKAKKQEEKVIKKKQKEEQKEEQKKINEKKKHSPEDIDGKLIFEFKRTGCDPITVIVDGNWLSIDRKGIYNTIKHGLDGIKKIHMKNISSVQFKEGSSVAAGYIQLAIQGSQESKGGFNSANYDENTIMFGASYNDLAKKLVNKIESKIDELQSSQSQTIIHQPTQTRAQQIKEFKELLDEGIITEEEFDKKKSELLK